MMTIQDIIMTS